ncbi:restriction endonuclease subunit S [Serratia marcescens]|uniref:restriction endonuclease subunit S n=1 Tax=Serratia marcescens TaxID=615 RepID=UPI001954B68D|nr:restriction endonuclease subunit S [Serratia marcescens]
MKKGYVPELRFPEFREEWKCEPMGAVYSFKGNNSLSREKLNYESGFVRNIHYGDIHTKYSPLFDITKEVVPFINSSESLDMFKADSYCIEGDIIFADASEDLQDIGKCIEIINCNNERLLSGTHTILARQIRASLVTGFGVHLFKSARIRAQIQKEAQGTKVLGLSVNRLSKIDVLFPANKTEQQKIADCLSSLDNVISLQIQKINVLQQFKKGLMQKLFPAEGETVPELRLPEFKQQGKWEQRQLGEIATFSSGGTPSKDIADYWNGTIPWISASSMYSTKLNKSTLNVTNSAIGNGTRIAKKGSLLILVRGSMLFNRIPMGIADIDVAFNQDVKSLSVDKKMNAIFLLNQLMAFESRIAINETGIGAGKIETEDLKRLNIYMPSISEQQKIADCLSSLDELIVTETQKLAALKNHKTGLMQQLFPAMDEVNA